MGIWVIVSEGWYEASFAVPILNEFRWSKKLCGECSASLLPPRLGWRDRSFGV
jgi:hypothetical protein